jgi:hypothetical protein
MSCTTRLSVLPYFALYWIQPGPSSRKVRADPGGTGSALKSGELMMRRHRSVEGAVSGPA